jgi:dTDP-glucose 4,6-dehydratase
MKAASDTIKLLVTGGSGFIGSNLVLFLHDLRPDIHIYNVDKLTYASDNRYLAPLKSSKRYHFSKIDLFDRTAVADLVRKWKPDGVIHLAAESHVDNSIKGPEPFVHSNLVGTFNLLEECRQLWLGPSALAGQETEKPNGDQMPERFRNRFLHVSTDEVYGTLGSEGSFKESTPYAPNSPYSATKAGSDMLVRSYHYTYGMDVLITNCSNNFGPHQHDEKLIPTVIRKALTHESIPVYGKGENVRDWLYVGDHCQALVDLYFKAEESIHYNIGGLNEWKNLDLVKALCRMMDEEVGEGPNGSYETLISFVEDRPGHDFRYSVDISRIMKEIGWSPDRDFDSLLRTTVKWYIRKYRDEQT